MSEEKPSEEHQQPGIGGEAGTAADQASSATSPAGSTQESAGITADSTADYVFGIQTPLDLATAAEIQPARSDQSAAPAGAQSNTAFPSSDTASQSSTAAQSNSADDDDGDVPPPPTYADLARKNLPQPSSATGQQQSASTGSNHQSASTTMTANSQSVVSELGASKFAVDEVISFGWKEMLKYFWPLAGVMTCTFLVQMVPTISSVVLKYLVSQTAAVGALSLIVSLIGAIIGVIIGLGTLNLFIKIVDGDTIAVRDVFSKYARAWNFALASLLYGLMVVAGYVCLIIPGVYLQLRFQFYPYFILDSDAGPITALKASWAITKGAAAEVFFLGIVNYFINWVGLLCLVIGMFPAYIVQNIALAKTYRQLRANTPLSEMPPNLMPLALISDVETTQLAG